MKKTKRKAKTSSRGRGSSRAGGNSRGGGSSRAGGNSRGGAGDSPDAVLEAIDKFVAKQRAAVDRLTDKAIKAKRHNPEQHRALQKARAELAEALKLRLRVAKVVLDVSQRLRMIENSARFAIATAFADYQQRTSRS